MSKHTPGPLNIHRIYGFNNKPLVIEAGAFSDGRIHDAWVAWDFRIAKGDKIVASMECSTANNGGWPGVDNPAEARANALLFIAAPELLEALKLILSDLLLSDNNWADALPSAKLAQAAIAKAEGGAQ